MASRGWSVSSSRSKVPIRKLFGNSSGDLNEKQVSIKKWTRKKVLHSNRQTMTALVKLRRCVRHPGESLSIELSRSGGYVRNAAHELSEISLLDLWRGVASTRAPGVVGNAEVGAHLVPTVTLVSCVLGPRSFSNHKFLPHDRSGL